MYVKAQTGINAEPGQFDYEVFNYKDKTTKHTTL